jgi:ABC-type transport system involved in multi-copper enzyme maturation permease subunit
MLERFTHIRILTWAALVETVRRKDLYVVAFLAVFGIAGGSVLATVGVRGIETFLRDFALMIVNLLSIAICIWLAARQLPEELSRRTLFPLLARPVRRFDVLLAKFLAVWALSCGALVVLAGIAWLALALFHAGIGPIFWQYLFLRMLSFGPIAALTMSMSLALSPAATVVLSGLLTTCWTLFSRTLADSIRHAPEVSQAPLKAVYFLLPHLDLFDLSARAAYNYPPVAPWVLGVLLLYAAAYVLVFLGLGELRFRRMAV